MSSCTLPRCKDGTPQEDRTVVGEVPLRGDHPPLLPQHPPTRKLVCLILLLVAATQDGRCQSTSAAVNGTVRDQSGAVVPEATVDFTNVNTRVQHVTATGSSGDYSLEDISPGNYFAQAIKDGFVIEEKQGIVLQVNQTAALDFVLTIGSRRETITVVSNLSVVDSTTSELGTAINTQFVADLPLNGRNFTQLLDLTPGISPVSVAQNSTGGTGFGGLAIGSFSFPAVNGQRNRSNMFLLDGSNDLAFLGNYNYAPIIDDIQEFKIQSNNDLAEFGGVSGGIVNVATKAGTNRFHGSAWEFLRNEQLDARDYFLPTRNPLRRTNLAIQWVARFSFPMFLMAETAHSSFLPMRGSVRASARKPSLARLRRRSLPVTLARF